MKAHTLPDLHAKPRLMRALRTCTGLLAAVMLTACGGGGSTASNGVGVGGTGSAAGPVTGFGSIIVNGIRFEDNAARIVDDDGASKVSADIKLGMIIEVKSGAFGDDASTGLRTATATDIAYGSSIKGVVSAKDSGASTITVLGQVIKVTSSTVFDGFVNGLTSVTTSSPNHLVEVHALLNSFTGQYTATRIERKNAPLSECKVTGVVSALNTGAQTFAIGGQAIAYSGASPVASLVNGKRVKARLAYDAGAGNCTQVATRVDSAENAFADNSSAEVEGFVSDFVNANDFKVNGVAVSAASVPGGVANGIRVEAEGIVRNGVLIASKVELKDQPSTETVKLYGTPSSVNQSADRLMLKGVEVSYATATLENNLTEGDLATASLEVRGDLDPTGTLVIATRIKRKD